MPRRHRTRKNKKNSKNDTTQNNKGKPVVPLNDERNNVVPVSISINNILTPVVATPSPKINNNAVQLEQNKNPMDCLQLTPVNPQRSFRRSQNASNFSNINFLFDSAEPLSSGPVKVDVATQTVYFSNKTVITRDTAVQYEEEPVITETPKLSQVLLEGIEMTPKHVRQAYDLKQSYADRLPNYVMLQNCNLNPYAKLNSFKEREASFFSPHFNNLQSASTPIDNLRFKNNLKFLTPRNDFNTLNKDILALQKRCYKSVSPKVNRYFNHSKHCNKSHNISLLRQKSPKSNVSTVCRKISVEEKQTTTGIGAKMFLTMKKYGRFTTKWSVKLIELCWELGINIKKVIPGR